MAGDVPVAGVSALHGDCAALKAFLAPGRTVALLGSSGAGKSTIVNRLLGVDRQATGAVRTSDSRGRHTTTTRELIPLGDDGILIDTPGLREVQLWADGGSVESVFDEVASLAANCRYHDCSHQGEQGCAVAAALATGTLAPERFQSYSKLLAEARRHESLADPIAAQERKRKWKRIHKAQREFYKSRPS
jgi:ribosome biogenesis GTPase